MLGTLFTAIGCSHPAVPAKTPPRLEFVGAWGRKGEGLSELVSPCCLATDSVGNIFVADVRGSSTLVHKFDREGHPLLAFYVDGAPRPSSMAVDYAGGIYLTHGTPGALFIFFPDGSHFRTIHQISGHALVNPEGVAIGESGSIYLTQGEGNCVLTINLRGRLLESWGTKGYGPSLFSSPAKVVAAPDGSIFVADTGSRRVERFRSDGTFVALWNLSFTDPMPEPGSNKGIGLAVSEKFVAALDDGSVQIWTLDGRPLLAATYLPPAATPETTAPADIAIAPNGDLLILDAVHARVLRFRVNF